MATAISITPTRFIASDGKLDSVYRYLFQGGGGFMNWPALNSHTVWTSAQFGEAYTYPGLAFDGVQVTAINAGSAPGGSGRLSMSV